MSRASLLATALMGVAAFGQASDLEPGATLSGALEASDSQTEERGIHDTVTLALPGGAPVVVDLTSDDFDTYLIVTLPDGSTMEDDDGGGGRNSRLIIPPADGEAVLVVMSFSGSSTGGYTVAAEEVAVERATVGTPLTGEVVGGASTVMLEVMEGQTLLIDVESRQFDTTLTLTDPSGRVLFDDDGGEGFNSRLILTPGETGDASLLVAGFGGGSGEYTLFARPLEPVDALSVGGELTSALGEGDASLIFSLHGEPGERVRIDLTSREFDTVLTGVSDTGELRTNDDVGADTNSRLILTLPESGTTHLLVSSFFGGTGSFTLQAAEVPPPMLPAFSLADLKGEAVSSADFEDQVLLINIWATWCGPCVEELPDINAISQELADRGLAVIGISMDDSPREVLDFLEETPLDFTVLMDDGRVSELLGSLTDVGALEGVPTTFIVDRAGVVRHILLGMRSHEQFLAAIEPLLDPAD